jgi:DNA-binding NtrC family response regulator
MKAELLQIFIVEDDVLYGTMLEHYLSLNPDYQIKRFTSAADFLNAIHENPDIITLDYSLPDSTGDKLFTKIQELSPGSKVIMISGQEDIKVAIDFLKKGVDDYIVKDEEAQNRVWLAIEKLKETIRLSKELESLKQEVAKKYDFQKAIIGNSPSVKNVFHLMDKAITTNITVSISGETGTGKELVAKSIHFNSFRKTFPFVPVNIAAVPRELLESELFGHEKGAFTGASGRRIGKFEEAHRGTIFLDEIGEMDLSVQAKLLRVLQEKEISRIGSNEIVKVDVRIVVATHRNLLNEVKAGRFREDLYYRLLGLPINVPPLRERGNDIILIARQFIENFCQENNLPKKTLSIPAKMKLLAHHFPGNVRELKSIVELACVMSDEEEIAAEHINIISEKKSAPELDNAGTLKQFNIRIIQHYLERFDYDVVKTAAALDIGKSTIYRMIQNNELSLPVKTRNQ